MSDRSSAPTSEVSPNNPTPEQAAPADPVAVQGEPAPLAEAPAPNATPAAPEGEDASAGEAEGQAPPVPSATLAEANKTREAYSALCADQAEVNFRKGAIAVKYVALFLATSPGKARRSTAVENLAEEEYLWDEASMAQPRDVAMRRMKERVNLLLRVNAVVNLLGDGRDVDKDTSGAKNRGARRRKKGDPVAWSTLSECASLIWREDDEHKEVWHALASVQDEAKALIKSAAKEGLARKDVAWSDSVARWNASRPRRRKARAARRRTARVRRARMATPQPMPGRGTRTGKRPRTTPRPLANAVRTTC